MQSLLLLALCLPTLLAADSSSASAWPFVVSSLDPSSYANIDFIQTQAFTLNVTVDFDKRSIYGTNTLSMMAVQDVSEIVLDYQGIMISQIRYASVDTQALFIPAQYETYTDPYLGNAVRIFLTDKVAANSLVQVEVTYNTTSESIAINWLTPAQTSSKTLAYMFTQCQDIHCRSIAPMQDTPAIKSTYSAYVHVKSPYFVYMSANSSTPIPQANGYTLHHFESSIPIPSYLLAFSVGNLTNTSVGTGGRTFVISEPDVLDKDALELSELDLILNTTEAFMNPPNPYMWGHYSIIVQPPSFPIGGMENPLLTFASPTIIVGDKSQTYLATHEIGHSWTGNDVTCRDWSNFWLNEGFTTFIERKISGQLDGEDFAKVESQLGNTSMWSDMLGYGLNNSYSSLFPEHNGHSPDDSSSQVTYEKGYQFLVYLESLMTIETDFRDLLRYYVNKYSRQSVTYLEFRLTFNEWLTKNYETTKAQTIIDTVDWDAWVKQPGAPPVTVNFTTAIANEFSDMADDYISKGGDASADKYEDYLNTTNPNLKVVFLTQLQNRYADLTYKIMAKIDADLNVTLEKNPEIGQRWFPLSIQMSYRKSLDATHKYVSTIGRQKYIVPVYQALVKYGMRNTAYSWFVENQNFYHPIAAKKIKSIIISTIDGTEEAAIAQIEQEILNEKSFLQ